MFNYFQILESREEDFFFIFVIIALNFYCAYTAIRYKDYPLWLIMISIGWMYGFLKLFDLTWLYPAYLWIVFNIFQAIITHSLIVDKNKLKQANKDLGEKITTITQI